MTQRRPARRRQFRAIGAAAVLLASALTYTAPTAPANAAEIGAEAVAELRAMATGEMQKLVVHDAPKPRIETGFDTADGAPTSIADFEGKVVLVNFWATWCPPCRAEMPAIDRMATDLKGEPVAVLPISTDFGSSEKSIAFFEEIGIETLEVYHDKSRAVAREAAILGLPVTIILDRQGREVARLVGDAHWDSPEAVAFMRRLAEMTGSADG